MGQCFTKNTSHSDLQSKKIDDTLRKSKAHASRELKLLLLGTGESGKSTIFKQMKIIHNNGYSQEEKVGMIPMIRAHSIDNVRELLAGADELGLATPELKEIVEQIVQGVETEGLRQVIVFLVQKFWNSPEIQEAYRSRNKFQLAEGTDHFFQSIERISAADYMPTYEDILKCRVRTTGVIEMHFFVDDVKFRMVDVGGQRNERRKWIHCFEDVQAVIFVTAISEFDQLMFEDRKTNRLQDSLRLFAEICSTRFFAHTSIILFLNKSDIFRDKVKRANLNQCFTDFTGGNDFDEAVAFLRLKFRSVAAPNQEIYTHVTCATDTGNVAFVFDAVKDSVLMQNFTGSGLI
eukprot:c26563_g1_i1.p1 GENE.c26563_g1_i1~~c26563_g1_i1.p1  ORF type:complete len:348 (-),score=76.23 c26563_g1_i1:235-1278(-)